MIKVDTRIKEDTYLAVRKKANDVYGGNFSLCLRLAIEKGINMPDERYEVTSRSDITINIPVNKPCIAIITPSIRVFRTFIQVYLKDNPNNKKYRHIKCMEDAIGLTFEKHFVAHKSYDIKDIFEIIETIERRTVPND